MLYWKRNTEYSMIYCSTFVHEDSEGVYTFPNIEWDGLDDWDFAVRFSQKYMIGYVNEILVDFYFSLDSISSAISAYYSSRCRMIADYKEQMIKKGVLGIVLNDLFQKTERRGVLEIVKEMLLVYIGK